MLVKIQKWDISEKESASDHNNIKFNISWDKTEEIVIDDPGRLRIKEHQHMEFYENLQRTASVTH